MTKLREAPKFLFERRADIEASHDYLLAGVLTINRLKEHKRRTKSYQDQVNQIVASLFVAAQMGDLPANGLAIGWPGDESNIEDDAMVEWRERSLSFLVRVRTREDGHVIVEVRPAQDERRTLH